ncbi:MAG: M28 family peptidase [Hyalangium sp.]|uniref:M28 family peptidase n=1 Tax=Hyalangium sp. TaxID=2028555 RepID=UPI00389ACA26
MLALWLSLALTRPPEPLPATAPAESFSAERAKKHLEVVASEPRFVGSAHHARVRDYLLTQLRELGFEAELQVRPIFAPERAFPFPAVTAENVVGRLRGAHSSGAVLLVAHYDSVPTGPGASDDGAAVASLLEVSRALRASPPLGNDVMVLFSDAEELSLLGAQAFEDTHAWARDAVVVLNVDARGNTGPVLMFETGDQSGGLVRQLTAVPRAQGSSAAVEVYRRMPNDTDFTVFRKAGRPGLNFANIEGLVRYHSRLETVEAVDPRTLQQQGEVLLGLVRRLSEADLSHPRESDRVFFNLGPFFVDYPGSWTLPLLFVAMAFLGGVLVWGFVTRRLRVTGVLRELAVLVLAVLAAGAAVWLGWHAVTGLEKDYAFLRYETYATADYIGACGLVVLGAVLAVLSSRRGAKLVEVSAAGCMLWALPTVGISLAAPGAGALFVWPLLAATGALALLVRTRQSPSPGQLVALGASALPAVLLMVPVLFTAVVALTLGMAWVPALLGGLMLTLLAPCLLALFGRALPVGAAVAVMAAVGVAGYAMRGQHFDPRHPRPSHLVYLLDADTRTAQWVSSDPEPSAWTASRLGASPRSERLPEFFPERRTPLLFAPAPAVALPEPELTVLADQRTEPLRKLQVKVAAGREGASYVDLRLEPVSALRAVQLAGERVEGTRLAELIARRGSAVLRYWAPPPEGFEVTLEASTDVPLKCVVSSHTAGWPAEASTATERPADTMPVPFGGGWMDGTRVHRTFTLNP